MKRIPILALATCLTLSACGGSTGGSGQLKMGIAVANISLNFAHEMVEGAQTAAEHEGGVDFKAVGPPNTDGPAEQQLFTNLATTNPDGVVLEPYQTYSDPNQNYGAWASLVHANAAALAFLGVGDADSYDLAKIKQTEQGKYLVAGADVDAKTLQGVKDGLDFVTIDPEHFLKGYVITALLIRSVKDKKPL